MVVSTIVASLNNDWKKNYLGKKNRVEAEIFTQDSFEFHRVFPTNIPQ